MIFFFLKKYNYCTFRRQFLNSSITRYRSQVELELALLSTKSGVSTADVNDLRVKSVEVLSAFKHMDWQGHYRLFEFNQDLPHAFAALCRNPKCSGTMIVADGTFQTVIKNEHLYIEPPLRETHVRHTVAFQSHCLIKDKAARQAFNRYVFIQDNFTSIYLHVERGGVHDSMDVFEL